MKKQALAIALLALAGCEFTTYEPIVAFGRLVSARDGVMSLTADGAYMFVYDLYASTTTYGPRLRVFDTGTGTQVSYQSMTGTSAPLAVAPDHSAGHESEAWVLLTSGYRIRYDTSLLGYTEIEVPIPTTGSTATSSRLYCDMDRSEDGVTYVATMDYYGGVWTSYLYREEIEGTWARVALTGVPKCARVSVDDHAGEVGVLDLTYEDLMAYDADDLVYLGEQDLSGHAGTASDVEVEGGYALIAYRDSVGTYDELVLYNPTGAVDDSTTVGSLAAIQIKEDAGEIWAWWTGLDASSPKYAAGRFQLE